MNFGDEDEDEGKLEKALGFDAMLYGDGEGF